MSITPYIETHPSRQTQSAISNGNSTTELLLLGGIFQGTADEVFPFSTITCCLRTDAPGRLEMQQSIDAINWDHRSLFQIEPDLPERHIVQVVARYFRIRYESFEDQSEFRLQTIYHAQKASSNNTQAANAYVNTDADVMLVKNVNEIALDYAKGNQNKKMVKVSGHGLSMTPDEKLVWDATNGNASEDFVLPKTASVCRVRAGGNAADAAAGAGARKIKIYGLDQDWVERNEELDLNGALESAPTVITYIRVNHIEIMETGTDNVGASGDIALINAAPNDDLMALIKAGATQSYKPTLAIPANRTGYLKDLHFSTASDKLVNFKLYNREFSATPEVAPFKTNKVLAKYIVQGAEQYFDSHYAVSFPEKSDVWITGSGDRAEASCEYHCLLVANLDDV